MRILNMFAVLLMVAACSAESSDPPDAAVGTVEVADEAPAPGASEAGDFRMRVMDVFSITGQGVVLTGRVTAGSASVGDIVCLSRAEGEDRELELKGVEQFRKLLDTAEAGQSVGLLFDGLEKSEVNRGDEVRGRCR